MLNDTRFDHTHNPFGVAVVALRVVFLVEAVAKEHRDALIQVGLESCLLYTSDAADD